MKKLLLSLLLSTITGLAIGQIRTITGSVKGAEDSEPLVGVTVQIKDSPVLTQTDKNGRFVINATNAQNVVLMIRYVGYISQERALRQNENSWDVKLTLSNDNNLNEVVVVGYGTQKKIHLTGAVSQVNLKAVEDIPTTNLASAIRGTLPNVIVSGGDTRPGVNAGITIRNPQFGTVRNTTDPLYIIDDAFRTLQDFNLLDQSEVESLTILKDASAAIYGIQGANGVIIVKTKRGKTGAPKVNYSGSLGLSDATQLPKMMSGNELATFVNDYYQAANNYTLNDLGVSPTGTRVPGYYTPDELAYFSDPANNTNWLEQAFKTAVLQRHALDVSGGSDKATYFAGATYVKQGSNFEGVKSDRWTYRASADARVANGLKVGLSLSGAINENTKYLFKQASTSDNDDFLSLLRVAPWQKYYIDGNPVLLSQGSGAAKENINFFAIQASDNYAMSRTYLLNINANIRYDVPFIKGLSLTGTYNKNYNITLGKEFGTYTDFYQYSGLGINRHIPGGTIINIPRINNSDRIRINPTFANNYQLNGIVDYSRKFGKHDFSVMALYEQAERYSEGVVAQQDGIYPNGLDNFNFAYGEKEAHQVGLLREYGRLAYAFRLNYNYANKYLLELAWRADANTNFAPGKEWGYFPSGSVGWVLSEEPFIKKGLAFVNYLKLRASIGLLGNDNSNAFQYLRNYQFAIGHAAVFGQPTGVRGSTVEPSILLANADARWDDNLKTNLGLDAQFLDNRLSFTVDGYFERRTNLLTQLSAAVPFIVGARLPVENYLDINNYGFEISFGWKDKIGKDLSYNFTPFLSWFDAKNVKIDQQAGINGTYLDRNGRSTDIGTLRYDYAGMIRTPADAERVKNELGAAGGISPADVRIFGLVPQPGMLYYKDKRGPINANGQYSAPDGRINNEDQDYVKRSGNNYNLGLNLGITFKWFSLNAITSVQWGGSTFVEGDAFGYAISSSTNITNRPEFWKDHWTPSNPDAAFPSPYFRESYNVTSQFWERSSTVFRLTNLNFSYAVPDFIAKKLGVANIRAYFNGQNLINFYNPFSYRDNGSPYTSYPVLKNYSFGLNVGF